MTQKKLHNLRNRARRIPRIIAKLGAWKIAEMNRARNAGREPALAGYDKQIARLVTRRAVLGMTLGEAQAAA